MPGLCLCTPECHTSPALNGKPPIQALTGQVSDISHFYISHFERLFTTLLPTYPRNQPWLLIIESEKPSLQDIPNSTGRMANPTLQTS